MPFRYPIALELAGRRCVVIGGGEVAEHKARALLEAGGNVAVVSEGLTDGLEQLGRLGEIELVRKSYSRGDLEGAFLAIAATDDPAVNAEIFEEAEERRVLLNAVDDIEHCHFAVPSIVRRGDFILAISTGGKAPALSRRLRHKLSKQFGREYGELVELLGQVRDETIRERTVDFATWARRWREALDHDLLGLVRRGRAGEAKALVRTILRGDQIPRPVPSTGRAYIVGAGPGDPGLITLRGKEVLDSADVVIYDRLVHPALIEGKEAIFAGKKPGHQTIGQEEINSLVIGLCREGKKVVRLKGGDPFVFGRGSEEAEALAEAGIPFEVVPGPTSAIAALSYAGIPVTDRRFSSSVAVVTGHSCRDEVVEWRSLATAVDTIVVLMGLGNLAEIARMLIEGGRDPATPAAVVESGTLPSQRVITAPLSELAAAATRAGLGSPAIAVVGEVVRLRERIRWFDEQKVRMATATEAVG